MPNYLESLLDDSQESTSIVDNTFLKDGFLLFGFECELKNKSFTYNSRVIRASYSRDGYNFKIMRDAINNKLKQFNLDFISIVYDQTPEVDIELCFPPMPYCKESFILISKILKIVNELGFKPYDSNGKIGGHIHISNFVVPSTESKLNILNESILYSKHNRSVDRNDNIKSKYIVFNYEPMQIELIKDVCVRYSKYQNTEVKKIVGINRVNSSYASGLNIHTQSRFFNATTIQEMSSIIGGKFNAINLESFNSGTIEFRQFASTTISKVLKYRVKLLMNMFYHSDKKRFNHNSNRVESRPSPMNLFRVNSFKNNLYLALRNNDSDSGIRLFDLMNQFSRDRQNIVSRISEISRELNRQGFPISTLKTFNQQYFNHRYSTSNNRYDLCSYKIYKQVEITTSESTLLDNNFIGTDSIYGSLDSETHQYFLSL